MFHKNLLILSVAPLISCNIPLLSNRIKHLSFIQTILISLLLTISIQAIDIRDDKTLRSLANKDNILQSTFVNNTQIDLYLKNGAWTGKIILPTSGLKENNKVIIHRRAGWGTTIQLNPYKSVSVPMGVSSFTYINNVWTTSLSAKAEIRDDKTLRSLANEDNVLQDMFLHNKEVYLYVKNGAWTGKIILPTSGLKENNKVIIDRRAGWGTNIQLNPYKSVKIPKGVSSFTYTNNVWTTTLPTKAQIRDDKTLRSLANKDNVLEDMFLYNKEVYLYVKNGAWTPKITLPQNNIREGSIINIHRVSGWGLKIYLSDTNIKDIQKGSTSYIYINGSWDNKSNYPNFNPNVNPLVIDIGDKKAYLLNANITISININRNLPEISNITLSDNLTSQELYNSDNDPSNKQISFSFNNFTVGDHELVLTVTDTYGYSKEDKVIISISSKQRYLDDFGDEFEASWVRKINDYEYLSVPASVIWRKMDEERDDGNVSDGNQTLQRGSI